jgi:hypothetical protein
VPAIHFKYSTWLKKQFPYIAIRAVGHCVCASPDSTGHTGCHSEKRVLDAMPPPPRGTDGRVRRNRSWRGSVGGRHAVAIGGRAGAGVVGLGPGNARPAAPAAETRTCGAATIGGGLAGAGRPK